MFFIVAAAPIIAKAIEKVIDKAAEKRKADGDVDANPVWFASFLSFFDSPFFLYSARRNV
jgi:hypothetical protein